MIQPRTGCWLHASYLTARLRWLRDAMPDTVISVHQRMSVGEYIYFASPRGDSDRDVDGGVDGNARSAHPSVGSGAAGCLRPAWS